MKGYENLIKGLDVGYSDTKDNDGRIFRSAFSHVDKTVLGARRLTVDGKDYYVGRGMKTSEMNKTTSEINKVCTLYNLALSGSNEFKLCVGLPVGQYSEQKKLLKDSIMEYNMCKVAVNGVPFSYIIKDVCVAMQGVASLYFIPDLLGDFIVIDIGGWTIDVSLVRLGTTESTLESSDTWYKGIRTIYSDVIDKINNQFSLTLDVQYAETVLKNGFIDVDGKEENIDFLKPYLQEYVNWIIEEIKLKYPWRTTRIAITGGGAILMQNAFKKHFPRCALLPDTQFSNARGYYAIACSKFR